MFAAVAEVVERVDALASMIDETPAAERSE